MNDVALNITLPNDVRKELICRLVSLCRHTSKMRYNMITISIAVPSQLFSFPRANTLPADPLFAATDAPDEGGSGTWILGVGGNSVIVESPSFVILLTCLLSLPPLLLVSYNACTCCFWSYVRLYHLSSAYEPMLGFQLLELLAL